MKCRRKVYLFMRNRDKITNEYLSIKEIYEEMGGKRSKYSLISFRSIIWELYKEGFLLRFEKKLPYLYRWNSGLNKEGANSY